MMKILFPFPYIIKKIVIFTGWSLQYLTQFWDQIFNIWLVQDLGLSHSFMLLISDIYYLLLGVLDSYMYSLHCSS